MSWLLAGGLCLLVLLVWLARPSKEPPRNLLLIGIDTLRPDHTSVYGYEKQTTPHLEGLAARGVVFADAMSHAPWTLPSVSSVLTSLYPSQHGAVLHGDERNLADDPPARLETEDSLVSILSRHGLRTRAVTANAFTGYGIDDQFDDFTLEHTTADHITDRGIHFLSKEHRKPFFLYLHYADPHEHHRLPPEAHRARFLAPEILREMGDREKEDYRYIHDNFGWAFYDAQTSFTDDQIGRLLRALREFGLEEDTLVVVYSDHGEELWEHQAEHHEYGTDPRGYYGIGHGQSLYQELLSVVLILAGGDLPSGRVVRGPVGLRDLAPTILDVMGIPPAKAMEGKSLLPVVAAGTSEDEVFSESIAYGHEKKALRRGRWKYIRSLPGPKEELYDLVDDPGEKTNLAAEQAERTAEMRARVDEIVQGFPEAATQAPELDDQTRRSLQALGYLTGGGEDGEAPAAR